MTMNRRNRERFAQTEIIELIQLHRRFAHIIHLVHAKHDRLARFQKHLCHLIISSSNSAFKVCHKNGDISFQYSKLRLSAHLSKDNIIRLRLDSARVNQHELVSEPFALCIYPISCDARSIFNYRKSLTDKLIKKSRLTNIRSANYRNDRQ